MNDKAKFIFLGTGGSMGIPVIGCECEVCTSTNPYNKRLRPSGLIQYKDKNLLIDCGPDFRQQALRYQIKKISGICFTHAHYDHTAGIDELRIYYLRNHQKIPCLLSMETAKDLQNRFYYLFDEKSTYAHLLAKFDFEYLVKDRGTAVFQNFLIQYASYQQIGMRVDGLRFGNLAYVTDIREYSDTIFKDLEGIEVLILSALRYTPSPMHLSLDEAVEFSRRVGAKTTWLTHIAHEVEHEKTNAYLPANVQLAYDGLELFFQPKIL